MKTLFQTLAVLLLLPICACSSATSDYADNAFTNHDYLRGLPADAPILQRSHSIFGTMNF